MNDKSKLFKLLLIELSVLSIVGTFGWFGFRHYFDAASQTELEPKPTSIVQTPPPLESKIPEVEDKLIIKEPQIEIPVANKNEQDWQKYQDVQEQIRRQKRIAAKREKQKKKLKINNNKSKPKNVPKGCESPNLSWEKLVECKNHAIRNKNLDDNYIELVKDKN